MAEVTLIDHVLLNGHFSIVAVDEYGNKTELENDHNLIVYSGRQAIAKGLLSPTSEYISTIAFGMINPALSPSMTEIETLASPAPVLNTDYVLNILDESGGTPPRIQYIISIPTTAVNLNNHTFNSMALMLNNGKAFAIKKFGNITKTDAISLLVTWSIFV